MYQCFAIFAMTFKASLFLISNGRVDETEGDTSDTQLQGLQGAGWIVMIVVKSPNDPVDIRTVLVAVSILGHHIGTMALIWIDHFF